MTFLFLITHFLCRIVKKLEIRTYNVANVAWKTHQGKLLVTKVIINNDNFWYTVHGILRKFQGKGLQTCTIFKNVDELSEHITTVWDSVDQHIIDSVVKQWCNHPCACVKSEEDILNITYAEVPSVLWRCWLGSKKGIRPVKNWVVGCWRGHLSGARCRLAYGPADVTATHCLLLQWNPDWFYLSGTGSPG